MTRRPGVYIPLLLLVVLFSILPMEKTTAAPLRLVALDVGEGQSILIKDDNHGILVDTGHPGRSFHVLSRLQAHGIKQLDYLILTHLHPDHAGGYFRIRKTFPHTPVLDNCHPIIASEFIDQDHVPRLHDALSVDSLRRCVKAGDTIFWRGHLLEFLWPYKPAGPDLNHHSMVLQIKSYNGKKLLIMGDVDRTVEEKLFNTRQGEWKDQGVDVFVAGHHGAADTGSDKFVELIAPQFAIVSVNKNNRNNYPADKTLQTLAKHSRSLYRTDQDGEICIVLSDQPVPCEGSFSKN